MPDPNLITTAEGVIFAAWALFLLVSGSCLIIGTLFFLSALRSIDRWHSRAAKLSIVMKIIAGIGLFYFSQTTLITTGTLYGTQDILIYKPVEDDWSSYWIAMCLGIVFTVGANGVVRGLCALGAAGRQEQYGRFQAAKGMFFIVGGIAAMNVVRSTDIISTTLGFSSPLTQ